MTKKEMIGRAYSSFTDKEKAEINKMISGTYYGMINGIEITDPYTLYTYQLTTKIPTKNTQLKP